MLAALQERSTSLLSAPTFDQSLQVLRKDVRFWSPSREIVSIEITVRNAGDQPTEAAMAAVQAAPLGAFVPWQFLGVADVPGLDAGQSHVIRLEAARSKVAALGSPDRIRPRRLLTALGAGDGSRPVPLATLGQLPADLFDLTGRSQVHWAGNLNVFVNLQPIERHLAQALRIYPGCTNMAMFVVGSGSDAYRFSLEGEGADWNTVLYDAAEGRSITDFGGAEEVASDEWIEIDRQALMMLVMTPPADCRAGTIEVHVLQRSTTKEAVVEFSLDPNAAGPGCFVV